jgi:hypothetical protein
MSSWTQRVKNAVDSFVNGRHAGPHHYCNSTVILPYIGPRPCGHLTDRAALSSGPSVVAVGLVSLT